MKLTSDWHIHSEHSCDCRGRGLSMAGIIERAAARGLADYGVTDHYHSRANLPDIQAARAAFDACHPPSHFHFGVEATCMRQPPAIDLTQEDIDALGIEYVIGAAHGAGGVPRQRQPLIEDHHRQYLFLATHPLVDIVAHPWWWAGGFENPDGSYSGLPWFDDFGVIPRSMHDEFAAALVEHETAAEINPGTLVTWHYPGRWQQQYLEYLASLAERGVALAAGSDLHDPEDLRFDEVPARLESVGILDQHLWRLPLRTDSVQ